MKQRQAVVIDIGEYRRRRAQRTTQAAQAPRWVLWYPMTCVVFLWPTHLMTATNQAAS
jgi:hypothetical protein